MEDLLSDCIKIYSGKFIVRTCSYESYLRAIMDGKESIEVGIIESSHSRNRVLLQTQYPFVDTSV